MSWWEVKKARDHGGLIHGRRRAVGDKFEAPETAMAFDAAQGIVARCDDPNARPGKAGKGDAAGDASKAA